ncbi:MAG: NifB/NifX family molybdenum-iron cluster-binding protein [Bacteroidota bacterium]
MIIAIPTDDRKTVTKRTGRCKEFAIVDINENEVKYDYVVNTHTHDHEHDDEKSHEHSHHEMVELLKDVDLLVVLNIGKHLKRDLEEGNIKYLRTKESEIETIVEKYKKGELE